MSSANKPVASAQSSRRHERLAAALVGGIVMSYAVLLLNGPAVDAFTREDRVFEALGGVSALGASVVFFLLFMRSRQAGKPRTYLAGVIGL